MSFLALLGALVLTYFRPHRQLDLLQQIFYPYAHWLEKTLNDDKRLHATIAWIAGALLPAVVVGALYYALLSFHVLAGLLFATAILYLTMCFSQFERHAEKIVAAMRDQNIDLARQQFERWEGVNTNRYSYTQLAGISIETTLSRAHYGLFGPVLWFIVLGPGGVILYRLAHLLKIEWQAPLGSAFSELSQYIFELVDWLPARVTAICFAIVGDFEDAVYCWRTQAANWPDKALGVILASGGGALGVKLGDPMPYQGVVVFRPELGLGDEADSDYLQSAIGMIWRVLLLLLSLLLLMTFAYWLGN